LSAGAFTNLTGLGAKTAAAFSALALTGGSATATAAGSATTAVTSFADGGVATADLRDGRFVGAGEEAMSTFVSEDWGVVRESGTMGASAASAEAVDFESEDPLTTADVAGIEADFSGADFSDPLDVTVTFAGL
jgi:hypothetical protein